MALLACEQSASRPPHQPLPRSRRTCISISRRPHRTIKLAVIQPIHIHVSYLGGEMQHNFVQATMADVCPAVASPQPLDRDERGVTFMELRAGCYKNALVI